MVIKSAQMGVPIVVSRSGITQMGHEIAQRVGLCAIGRATNKHFLCYAGAERLRAAAGTGRRNRAPDERQPSLLRYAPEPFAPRASPRRLSSRPMNASLRLGWRTLWRDLRAGELRLLIVAVLLAVAALTAVGFFADRLKGGLQRDARQLLGGDAVLASDNPTPAAFVERARALGLQGAEHLRLSDHGARRRCAGRRQQAGRAEGGGGGLSVARQPAGRARRPARRAQPTRDVPAPGEVWVDASLLESLALKVGDTLLLGDTGCASRA